MQEILPPLPAAQADDATDDALVGLADETEVLLPDDLEFEPLLRKEPRWDSITPLRQRQFIRTLAECGSVKQSCRAVSASPNALYGVRNAPGGESFARAWNRAIQRGTGRVLDVFVDQAIHGSTETITKDGKVIAERRRYSTRSMMWLLSHHMPERFPANRGVLGHGLARRELERLKQAWRKEWDAEQQQQGPSPEAARANILAKVAAVQKFRMAEYAADPAKRAAYELLHGETDWMPHENPPRWHRQRDDDSAMKGGTAE